MEQQDKTVTPLSKGEGCQVRPLDCPNSQYQTHRLTVSLIYRLMPKFFSRHLLSTCLHGGKQVMEDIVNTGYNTCPDIYPDRPDASQCCSSKVEKDHGRIQEWDTRKSSKPFRDNSNNKPIPLVSRSWHPS